MAEIITTPLGTGSLSYNEPWQTPQQTPSEFRMAYLPSDVVTFQYRAQDATVTVRVINTATGAVTVPDVVATVEDPEVFNVSVTGLPIGPYELQIMLGIDVEEAWPFDVCGDLPGTKLIEWYNRRTDFGVVFDADVPFYFRVPAEFFPQDAKHAVSANPFRDQDHGISQLSAKPYKTEILTVGGVFGVPDWVGEKLNQIFSCTRIVIDGAEYVRSEGAELERVVLEQMSPLYLFRLPVEKTTSSRSTKVGDGEFSDEFSTDYYI